MDGPRVHHEPSGQGPALVLLHGSGSSLQHFDRATSPREPAREPSAFVDEFLAPPTDTPTP
ncbi:hypothetical protein ACFUIY_14855 [Streptomyces griseorubiginosus]|uniref:hypothetical protein n=1 Tax=Streptomyces griseorubiginosus TaxID=67304 RepID=UPI003638855D